MAASLPIQTVNASNLPSPSAAPQQSTPTTKTTNSIPASTLARWGPRWSPNDLIASITQYSLESGWVEGTVYQWSVTQTHDDDIVFHTALDAMAATLHRSKSIFIHSPALSEEDSLRVADAVEGVKEAMAFLLEQFRQIRPLETEVQAFNVGIGMEEHYKLFTTWEVAVRQKVVGEAKEKLEGELQELEKNFESTIVVFKGVVNLGEEKKVVDGDAETPQKEE